MEIWDGFLRQENWRDLPATDRVQAVHAQGRELVDYFTKFTDYMANVKIAVKDMAISR